MQTLYYRTVDKANNIIETWPYREQVKPLEDYHRIEYVRAYPNQDIPPTVIQSYTSMYNFHNIPS